MPSLKTIFDFGWGIAIGVCGLYLLLIEKNFLYGSLALFLGLGYFYRIYRRSRQQKNIKEEIGGVKEKMKKEIGKVLAAEPKKPTSPHFKLPQFKLGKLKLIIIATIIILLFYGGWFLLSKIPNLPLIGQSVTEISTQKLAEGISLEKKLTIKKAGNYFKPTLELNLTKPKGQKLIQPLTVETKIPREFAPDFNQLDFSLPPTLISQKNSLVLWQIDENYLQKMTTWPLTVDSKQAEKILTKKGFLKKEQEQIVAETEKFFKNITPLTVTDGQKLKDWQTGKFKDFKIEINQSKMLKEEAKEYYEQTAEVETKLGKELMPAQPDLLIEKDLAVLVLTQNDLVGNFQVISSGYLTPTEEDLNTGLEQAYSTNLKSAEKGKEIINFALKFKSGEAAKKSFAEEIIKKLLPEWEEELSGQSDIQLWPLDLLALGDDARGLKISQPSSNKIGYFYFFIKENILEFLGTVMTKEALTEENDAFLLAQILEGKIK